MTGHVTLPCEVYTFIFDNEFYLNIIENISLHS